MYEKKQAHIAFVSRRKKDCLANRMTTASARLRFRLFGVYSLKEKRAIARRLIEGTKHMFNASVSEVSQQDSHEFLVIGVAVVSGEVSHARKQIDSIIRWMEENTEAELFEKEIDISSLEAL